MNKVNKAIFDTNIQCCDIMNNLINKESIEKINIAELLRDCPSGMELDCVSYDNVSFDKISDDKKATYPIFCYITDKEGNRSGISFTENGCESKRYGAKCVIFPKDKTSWEGFVPPCKFKDGDVLYVDCTDEYDDEQHEYIFILNRIYNGQVHSYCHYYIYDGFHARTAYLTDDKYPIRFATEEEKQKLFQAIKDNGYKWNAETKTLEKLFEPKFKVGDKIRHKDDKTVITITRIKDDYYFIQYYNSNKNDYQNEKVSFKDQDKYELIPNKFDINTLVPFESKVLVRDNVKEKWHPGIWGYYDENSVIIYQYRLIGDISRYCIPYEGNEHLLGTTDDCSNYFKTWE